MYLPGHVGTALLVYSIIGYLLISKGYRDDAIAGGAVMVLFTMHPDVDTYIASIPHREITHTVWFALFVGVGCAFVVLANAAFRHRSFNGTSVPAAWAFSLGTLSIITHLLADVITPWGIMPLFPVSDTLITFDLVLASNDAANMSLLAAGLFATALSWHYGHRAGAEMYTEEDATPSLRAIYRRIVGSNPRPDYSE